MELEDRKKKQARKARRKLVLYLLFGLVLAVSLTPKGKEFWGKACSASGLNGREVQEQLLEIHVIDVGKADAILIRSQGHAALLDAGTVGDGDHVSDYLFRFGVEALDYAIVSHTDSDHIGGMSQVLWDREVQTLIHSSAPGEPETPEYENLKNALRRFSVEPRQVEAGESFSLGAARFTVVGPISYTGRPNDDSLVLRLECGDFSALFCGDAEKAAEEELVASGENLQADLLKVAHHGSATSSTQEFLERVRPRYGVISVGPDRNRLPSQQVLQRLEEMGTKVFATDVEGDIVFSYNGEQLTVRTGRKAGKIW